MQIAERHLPITHFLSVPNSQTVVAFPARSAHIVSLPDYEQILLVLHARFIGQLNQAVIVRDTGRVGVDHETEAQFQKLSWESAGPHGWSLHSFLSDPFRPAFGDCICPRRRPDPAFLNA